MATPTPAQLRVRTAFGQASRECSAKVAHLPPGERRQAFLKCVSQKMQVYGKNPVGPG